MIKKISFLILAGVIAVSSGIMSGCANSPTVDNFTQGASRAAREANAMELSSACKTLYAGVSSGTINSDTPAGELNGLSSYKLPGAGATAQERKNAADALTIGDVVAYEGSGTKFTGDNISEYGYDTSSGSIYYRGSNSGAGLSPLSMSTTLGEMMKS